MGERCNRTAEVRGSIPLGSTTPPMTTTNPAIPAATLIVLRAAHRSPPDILVVQRAASMAFAAGAFVFPGGRVDPDDRMLAARCSGDVDDAAARIAAIRETLEETGVPVGLAPMPSPACCARWRADLHAGAAFSSLLDAAGVTLCIDRLLPFARWQPPPGAVRTFDTRFFVARLPDDAPPASVDRTENAALRWTSASAMLAEADAGRARIIYPTRRNLERLAASNSIDAIVDDARAHPVRLIVPFVERRDGIDHLCISDGLGYPVTGEPVATALRG